MEKFQGKINKIVGDASFRQFYRLKKGAKTSIIVKTNKEKYKNLVVYTAINKFLKKNNILAPQTTIYNINKGIIEIDDFGDCMQPLEVEYTIYRDNSIYVNEESCVCTVSIRYS